MRKLICEASLQDRSHRASALPASVYITGSSVSNGHPVRQRLSSHERTPDIAPRAHLREDGYDPATGKEGLSTLLADEEQLRISDEPAGR